MINDYYIVTMPIDNGQGHCNYNKVIIYMRWQDGRDDIYCGEYIRHDSSMYNTFVPFMKDGKEYALFSDDYTKTSVMTLPDCKKIATEESEYFRVTERMKMKRDGTYTGGKTVSATREEFEAEKLLHPDYRNMDVHAYEGFCPVDFYVPESETEMERPYHFDTYYELDEWDSDNTGNFYRKLSKLVYDSEIKELVYELDNRDAKYAFVAGCIWGDDTSWKIERLDLSEIESGIVKRTQPFGYVSLADGIKLSDAISVDEGDMDCGQVRYYLAISKTYIEQDGVIDKTRSM